MMTPGDVLGGLTVLFVLSLFLVCVSCNKTRNFARSARPVDNRAYRSTYGTRSDEFSSPRYSHVYQKAPIVRTTPPLLPQRVAKPVNDRTYHSTYGTQSNEFSSPRYSHVYPQPPTPRAPPLPPRVAEPVYDRTSRSTYGTQANEFSSSRYSHVCQQAPIARAPLLPPRVAPPSPPPKRPRFQPTLNSNTAVAYSSPWVHPVSPPPPNLSHLPDPQPHAVSAPIPEPLPEQSPGDRLRAIAKEECDRMRTAFNDADHARIRGHRALARNLGKKGKEHMDNMQRWNKEASDEIFADKNKGRSANEIDLHGLFVAEAEERVEEHIILAKVQGHQTLRLIVGQGLHAEDGVSKMKPAMERLIQKMELTAKYDTRNAGVMIVQLGSESEEVKRPRDPSKRGRRKKKSQNERRV